MKTCSTCGTSRVETAKFCSTCGQALVSPTSSMREAPEPQWETIEIDVRAAGVATALSLVTGGRAIFRQVFVGHVRGPDEDETVELGEFLQTQHSPVEQLEGLDRREAQKELDHRTPVKLGVGPVKAAPDPDVRHS